MRALLVLTAVMIFYGSIYPLNFSTYTYTPERMAQLVDFSLRGGSRGNIIANILLFVPYGFFSIFATRDGRRANSLQIVRLSFAGLVVAYAAQVAQVFIANRVPSGVDVVWNLFGMLAGLLLGLAVARTRQRLPALPLKLPLPLLLVAGWLAYQWIPFVPTLDLGLLRDNAVSLLARRVPEPFWVFQNTLLWLVCYQLLERYAPAVRAGWYLPGTGFVLAVGALFVGSTVNIDDVAGALCALILWRLLRGRWYPAILAMLLMVAIVGASFLSLTLRDTPASFSWIPFSGSLGGNIIINVIATWKKLVLYGLLAWLLMEARLSLLAATAFTALLLFTSEWFQIYIRGATPEVTDALMALGIGAAIALRGERPQARPSICANIEHSYHSRGRGWLPAIAITATLMGALGVLFILPEGPTAVIRGEVPWARQRANLIAEQTQALASDRALGLSEQVAKAAAAGCDVIALSDRVDTESADSGRQRKAVVALRQAYPDLLIFLGLALELPSHPGREHLNVLLQPDQETAWLPRLKNTASGSRSVDSPRHQEQTFASLLQRIRAAGHAAFLTDYHSPEKVVEVDESPDGQNTRLVPTSADTVWDLYLSSGQTLWAALARPASGNGDVDAQPCSSSRMHIATPERSYTGVLRALEAGTFWSDHGLLLDHLALEVEFDGIPRALAPGESADVFSSDSVALARVNLERGAGGAGAALDIDFISSCLDGQSQIISRQLSAYQSSAETLLPLQATGKAHNSCIIRARVRRQARTPEPELVAYTNYIRVHLRLGVLDGGILDWRLY